MNSNPREINAHLSLLMEEFRQKGYQCHEEKNAQTTIVYLRHDKKLSGANDNKEEPTPAIKKFQGFSRSHTHEK
jgi:hypothetical protein